MSITLEILEKNGVEKNTAKEFETYYRMLTEWNEKINLTAITDETEVCQKHFLDCLAIFESGVIKNGDRVVDVGTGAGLPGLVMKIGNKELDMTLMDSLGKRINFLNEFISNLNLNGITTVHSRAEDFGKDKEHREKYDVCVSRAVANLATLSELCLPLVKKGGYFVSMKGPKAKEEIEEAKKAIGILGGRLEEVKEYKVDGTDFAHNLVIIKKMSNTPNAYPRKAPKPAKEPIK